MALGALWLKQCVENHEHCAKLDHNAPLPKRVIDVGSSRSIEHPFLHESQGQVATYVALSHRWGGENVLTTRMSTIAERRRHLPMARLPTTFRQAIKVTRSLGFQYLWIDSLCIVQDSVQDWTSQSSQMAQIYGNAAITIAATDSQNGDDGLFTMLPGKYTNPCFLGQLEYETETSYNNGRFMQLYVRKEPKNPRGDEVSSRPRGPLDTRAWVLQEELLSQRVLYFTKRGLYWECQHSDASESRPEGCCLYESGYEDRFTPAIKYARSFRRMINPAASEAQQSWARVSPVGAWQSLVADYTSRNLTRDSDVAFAIKGIADAIAGLIQEEYTLGLWLGKVPIQLCWHVDMGRVEYMSHTSRIMGDSLTTFSGYKTPPPLHAPHRREDFQAPSWTWLSSTHPIKWETIDPNGDEGLESMIDIYNIGVSSDVHNEYRGYLQVEGVLATTIAISRQVHEWEHLIDPFNDQNRSQWLYYDDVTWEDPRMICLAVAKTTHIVYCLVIHPCSDAFDCTQMPQYRRIGYAEWPANAWAWLTTGVPPKRDEKSGDQASSGEDSPETGEGLSQDRGLDEGDVAKISLQDESKRMSISAPAGIDHVKWDSDGFNANANHAGLRQRLFII